MSLARHSGLKMYVLERALEVLPHMATYVKAVEEKRCQNPGTKSFEVIQEAVDPLVTPDHKAMVPFLSTDLFKLLKSSMSRFIKPDLMKETKTPQKRLDV